MLLSGLEWQIRLRAVLIVLAAKTTASSGTPVRQMAAMSRATESGSGVAPRKQAQIHGGPVWLVGPQPQQHRALEHEPFTQLRAAEPVQEALEEVVSERDLEVFTTIAREIEKARADGGGTVPWFLGLQPAASRYGRITFATRQIFAKRHSASAPRQYFLR